MTTEAGVPEAEEAEDHVLRTIRKVISEIARIEPEELRLDSPVSGLRNVDSIILLEIVVRTEVELGIEIDEQDLFDISTVRDFLGFCRNATASKD
ncbi:Acyl carrier protein [Streptomyces avidinii]